MWVSEPFCCLTGKCVGVSLLIFNRNTTPIYLPNLPTSKKLFHLCGHRSAHKLHKTRK